MTLDLPNGSLTVLSTPETSYLKLPDGAKQDVPTPWVSIDNDRATSAVAGFTGGADQQDGRNLLAMLGATSEDGVDRVGDASVRGVDTTHYRAKVDLAEAVKQQTKVTDPATFQRFIDALDSKTVTVDAWIDEEGRARKLRSSFDTEKQTVTMTAEFYDFGKAQPPTPPRADQVTDITDRLVARTQAQPAPAA
jgi:hypothetical protein